MEQVPRCDCDCHIDLQTLILGPLEKIAFGVPLDDPVEAAVACSKCKNLHVRKNDSM